MGYAENIVVFTLNFIVMQVEPLTVKIKLKEILLPYFFLVAIVSYCIGINVSNEL